MNRRIVAVHMAALAAYCGLIALLTHYGSGSFMRGVLTVLAVGVHALVLLIRFADSRSEEYLLSLALVLLIGYSFCTHKLLI